MNCKQVIFRGGESGAINIWFSRYEWFDEDGQPITHRASMIVAGTSLREVLKKARKARPRDANVLFTELEVNSTDR